MSGLDSPYALLRTESRVRGSERPRCRGRSCPASRRHHFLVALPRDPSELPPPRPDGRILHPAKPHSSEKLHYWSRVVQEYATRTKYKWAGRRVCVDLFASCGIWEDTKTKEIGWGSPLLALHAIDAFDAYIFCELNADRATALADRADETGLLGAPATRLKLDDPHVLYQAREFKNLTVAGAKCAGLTG